MQESCITTETASLSTGSSTASNSEEPEALLRPTLATTSLGDSPPLIQPTPGNPEEPTAKRAKKKTTYYPAPKSRSKPWQRPRGKRGWIKKTEAEAAATTETSVEAPLESTSTRTTTTTTTTTTITTHVCTESPPPRQLCGPTGSHQPAATTAKRELCAVCSGAPTSSSWCTCSVSFSQLSVPTLCAHCLGAPTGSGVCTCEHDLFDGLWCDKTQMFLC
jgi:hypothetical protein